ncbi:NAD(P)H-dependent flavin oxidoreductase [Chungangia koreensis]|uniref:Probable nitronate monooxygenase n=1 Tax=Chungangia koreensis TaxID=752657 RepID=A0ABV8X6U2_9LACT
MKWRTRLCERLGIELPIIQAGMAGGITSPEMVFGVSNAGGLGTLGAAYMKPEEIREAVKKIRANTDRPYAVNLFSVNLTDDFERLDEVQSVLNPIREKFGIQPSALYRSPDLFEEQMTVLFEERVPIISTAFGCLPERHAEKAKDLGMKIMTMVTTVEEAVEAERRGADVIVAQGSEAGGHRGTFDVGKYPNGANVGTFALVPQVADAVKVPVVAAGGIMDGRGLAAALSLGADGIQMGTRFLTSIESTAHQAYKEALLRADETSTQLTKNFSGRPARGIRNSFIEKFEDSGVEPLPFPSQNTITNDIRAAAKRASEAEYMSLWGGQGLRLLKEGQTVSQIIAETIDTAEKTIQERFGI